VGPYLLDLSKAHIEEIESHWFRLAEFHSPVLVTRATTPAFMLPSSCGTAMGATSTLATPLVIDMPIGRNPDRSDFEVFWSVYSDK